MSDPYGPEVRRRFAAPVGAGAPPEGSRGWFTGEAQDPASGTRVRAYLRFRDAQVVGLRYEVFGCPHTIAALSWLAELVERRELRHLAVDLQGIAGALGVPAEKRGRLLVIEDALRAAGAAGGLI
jgi:NifU-like protein involved in Fe-S cluster formation